MAFSISKDTWHSQEDALLEAHSEVVQVVLGKNRKELEQKKGSARKMRTLW